MEQMGTKVNLNGKQWEQGRQRGIRGTIMGTRGKDGTNGNKSEFKWETMEQGRQREQGRHGNKGYKGNKDGVNGNMGGKRERGRQREQGRQKGTREVKGDKGGKRERGTQRGNKDRVNGVMDN